MAEKKVEEFERFKMCHYSYCWSGLTKEKCSVLIPSSKFAAGALQLRFSVNFLSTVTYCAATASANVQLVRGAKNVKFSFQIKGNIGDTKIDVSGMKIIELGGCGSLLAIEWTEARSTTKAKIQLELYILNETPLIKVPPPDISTHLKDSLVNNESLKDIGHELSTLS